MKTLLLRGGVCLGFGLLLAVAAGGPTTASAPASGPVSTAWTQSLTPMLNSMLKTIDAAVDRTPTYAQSEIDKVRQIMSGNMPGRQSVVYCLVQEVQAGQNGKAVVTLAPSGLRPANKPINDSREMAAVRVSAVQVTMSAEDAAAIKPGDRAEIIGKMALDGNGPVLARIGYTSYPMRTAGGKIAGRGEGTWQNVATLTVAGGQMFIAGKTWAFEIAPTDSQPAHRAK